MALLFFSLMSHAVLSWSTTQVFWGVLASMATVALVAGGLLKTVHPKWKEAKQDIRAGRDALLGRPAVYDSITREIVQAELPGIGVRMANNEVIQRQQAQQLTVLTDAVTKIADSHSRMDLAFSRISKVEEEVVTLRDEVKDLKVAAVERIVSRQDSVAAFRAIEAAQKATPTDEESIE